MTVYTVCLSHISRYFNPHEREARDFREDIFVSLNFHFNPHEREARDVNSLFTLSSEMYFNPHEREARDRYGKEVG